MAFGDLVQDDASVFSTGAATTIVFGNDVTEGNLLVVRVSYASTTLNPAITDSLGHTYTQVDAARDHARMFWTIAESSAACTVTITGDGTTDIGVSWATEFEGPFAPSPVHDSAGANAIGTAISSGLLTITRASLLVGYIVSGSDASETSDWTETQEASCGGGNFGSRRFINAHLLQVSAADDTLTGTQASNAWGALAVAFVPVPEIAAESGAYVLTGSDVIFELATSTTGGLIFDYVLAQESSEAIWPSRMTQLADWAVPVYLDGERVVLYTKSGSNQIWILGGDDTGTLTSYIDLPWMSRLDDTKVAKWLGLIAAYASTVPVDVYVRYANNPGEFDDAVFTLRGTLPANPTISEGARIGFGGSTRWVQVRFQADTLNGGGFELFPPVHLIPVDTQRIPN